jgi:subtilisin family serine protease
VEAEKMEIVLPESPEDTYDPGVFIIKFYEDVPDISIEDGDVVTGIQSIDALNAQYGVYDYEELHPLPPAPVNHPQGLWSWDDYLAARAEFNLQREFVFKVNPDNIDPAKIIIKYSEDENTEYVELDWTEVSRWVTPNDPGFRGQELDHIKCEKAWDIAKGENNIIAVLDTGCHLTHVDMDAKYEPGWDFRAGNDNPYDHDSAKRDPGHGTHVAGIAAAETNNGEGLAGVGWLSKIIPIRVLKGSYPKEEAKHGHIAQAIRWATGRGADVINMSFGYRNHSRSILNAVNFAYKLDVVLFAAAGNNGAPNVSLPARLGGVIAVGAVTSYHERWDWSNYGADLELVAPAVYIPGPIKEDPWYATKTGTSQASPHAAGVALLCRSKWPNAKASQIRKILQGFSDDIGPRGWDSYFGWG